MNADDLNFAYKVRHALNEHLDNLPESTAAKLAAARQQAIARKKPDAPDAPLRVAGRQLAGVAGLRSFSMLGRLSVVLPLVALVAGLTGIYQYEEQQRIAEIAELDAAVLADELPLNAYLDQGFNAYLAQRGQQ